MVFAINNLNNLTSLLTEKVSIENGSPLRLGLGQKIMALVIKKEGDTYLLQKGENSFSAKATTVLSVGEWVKLEVIDNEGENILLKHLPAEDELIENNQVYKRNSLIKKYGDFYSKDVATIDELLSKFNLEDNKGIRALLDPHILSSIFIPEKQIENYKKKIEMSHYKDAGGKKSIFEIGFDLDFKYLGQVEVIIKWIDGSIYTRIWSESEETCKLLLDKKDELKDHFSWIEVLTKEQGPLLTREVTEKIDVKV